VLEATFYVQPRLTSVMVTDCERALQRRVSKTFRDVTLAWTDIWLDGGIPIAALGHLKDHLQSACPLARMLGSPPAPAPSRQRTTISGQWHVNQHQNEQEDWPPPPPVDG